MNNKRIALVEWTATLDQTRLLPGLVRPMIRCRRPIIRKNPMSKKVHQKPHPIQNQEALQRPLQATFPEFQTLLNLLREGFCPCERTFAP